MRKLLKLSISALAFALLTGCGTSPEEARQKLADLNIEYSKQSFAKRAAQGDQRAVELFLKTNLDPKVALGAAAANDQKEIVQKLLEAGGEPNAESVRAAVRGSNTQMVKLLLDRGEVKPNSEMLHDAVSNGDAKMVKLLTEAGASPGERSLLEAVRERDLRIVDLLLGAGANPNAWAGEQKSVLYTAITWVREDCNAAIVRSLLDAGADPNQVVLDNPVLWIAAFDGEFRCVKALAEGGADLDVTTDVSPLANREEPETILDQMSGFNDNPNKEKIAEYLQNRGVNYLNTEPDDQH